MIRATDAIGRAIAEAFRRFAEMEPIDFGLAAVGLCRELPAPTRIADGLLQLAHGGSVEAVAALNVLAMRVPRHGPLADEAFRALMLRNGAVREEIFAEGPSIAVEHLERACGVFGTDPDGGRGTSPSPQEN